MRFVCRMTELSVLECSHLPWKRVLILTHVTKAFGDGSSDLRLVTYCLYKCALDACMGRRGRRRSERRTKENTRKTNKAKSAGLKKSRLLERLLNLFCASVLELCSTEVELFVLVE